MHLQKEVATLRAEQSDLRKQLREAKSSGEDASEKQREAELLLKKVTIVCVRACAWQTICYYVVVISLNTQW